MKYPDHLNVCPAVMLHPRLVCRVNLAIRDYCGGWHAGREFGISLRRAARREAVWRRYQRDREVRLERRAWALVDEFHQGLGIVAEEFLTHEDRISFQQVHDGVAEGCIWNLASLVLGRSWLLFLVSKIELFVHVN